MSLAALDERLVKRRMAKHTRRTYAEVTSRMLRANPDAGDAPTADAVIAFAETATRGRPIGTVLPTRAAVKHYLIAALGFSEEEAQEALPSARGRPHRLRDSLSSEQLATYYRVIDSLRPGAVRTILALLPRTGLRIGEACSLRLSGVEQRGNTTLLRFRGKGDKERIVPLTTAAKAALNEYLEATHLPDDYLFPGMLKGHLTPEAVRKTMRRLRGQAPALGEITPHVLRHTWATGALRAGVDLRTVQAAMGHSSVNTTMRYLHPDTDMLVAAMERAGG